MANGQGVYLPGQQPNNLLTPSLSSRLAGASQDPNSDPAAAAYIAAVFGAGVNGNIQNWAKTADPSYGFALTKENFPKSAADYLASLGQPSGSSSNVGSGGGYSMAAIIQAAIDKINEDHARQVAAIGVNRDQGAASIANAFSTFQQGSAANDAQYNTASDSINRAIADRLAQALAQQKTSSDASAQQASQLGWNGAAIQANADNNNTALQNVLRYQQDLADRYRQVQSNSQGQNANAGALMNQGAQGQLANNYNSAINAADAAASDARYKAQQPTVVGGGGGGGSSSKSSSSTDNSELWKGLGITPAEAGIQYALFNQDPSAYMNDTNNAKFYPVVGSLYAANHKFG